MTDVMQRVEHFTRELLLRMRVERDLVLTDAGLSLDGLARVGVTDTGLKVTASPVRGMTYFPAVLCVTDDPLQAAEALVTHCMAVSFAEAIGSLKTASAASPSATA